ncbi:hypothetical protein AK88_03189 [Plasmodium fragile]|uniref:Uncharacterized protein n=1 Tax=Plasmodium fragile TaxID=5857 RepID=A0A0D9QK33_PLAFR|nr:uncharacterized protein AK88_03189 [Plasmodium fragile]KJP87142.1 hypothetical protein AK88_03189 [Plasmodium fragile]
MEKESQEMSLDGDLHLECNPQGGFKENKSCDVAEEGCHVIKEINATNLGHREEEVGGQEKSSSTNHTCEQPQWNCTNRMRQTRRNCNGPFEHEENCLHLKALEIFHHLGEEGTNQGGDDHSSTSCNDTDYTNFEDSDAEVDSCGDDEEDVAQEVNFGTTKPCIR